MKYDYEQRVIGAARAILAAAHQNILNDFVGKDVTVSSYGRRSVIGAPLQTRNGLYTVGRAQFTVEQVINVTLTPIADGHAIIIHI